MTRDGQVRRLWELLSAGVSLRVAALRTGMDEKTARKYRREGRMPSELSEKPRWRTRPDPFADVWEVVWQQLAANPRLQAKALFAWLQRESPGRFEDGQLRTFQRGVQRWRALQGPGKEVYFSQIHEPGRLCASDFTHMTELGVTICGEPLAHLVYHFVLTYSNWEWGSVCFSESFDSLSAGLQGAVWELGGVPARHRTDRLSAAVNNLTEEREFTERYRGLMAHYGLQKERIQARQAHENGDVESSHRHFKEAVDQALMLRGSREFESRDAYREFLEALLRQRNAGRQSRLREEQAALRALPARRYESCRLVRARVGPGSTIRVDRNTYSVPSRLIGVLVDVQLFAEDLAVWYGGQVQERLPRLCGRGQERINYRHVIEWLVRKPGAFERYRHREDLFPTSRFRMAYDALQDRLGERAAAEYLAILELAARESEAGVDDALRVLLGADDVLTARGVEQFVRSQAAAPEVTEVRVAEVDLSCFDALLEDREVWSVAFPGSADDVAGAVEDFAAAGVS